MVKTLTIADDVYEELSRIKGNRSFSEVLRELLREKRGNAHVINRIFGILSEEEYKEVKKKLREVEEGFDEWQRFLIRA
ncbi:antitoxin VapB family protein [Thermococcus sp.]|uniref:antitoxin VapB family protein n=1 Tax=Thermococcus sp. TaxID=35749 RepID=UPI0026225EB9|nr:antitoxin VapB family protein [Thermococcus sp.]